MNDSMRNDYGTVACPVPGTLYRLASYLCRVLSTISSFLPYFTLLQSPALTFDAMDSLELTMSAPEALTADTMDLAAQWTSVTRAFLQDGLNMSIAYFIFFLALAD